MRRRILAVRLDSDGDVLLTGPAIRALAAAGHVTLLCGPRGRHAAELLPGVDGVVVWRCPWIEAVPDPVDRRAIDALVDQLSAGDFHEAVIFTSFHQSALPTALMLRLAGVPRISAISEDYPGGLLDVRHRIDDAHPASDMPESERALSLATAAGFPLPSEDNRRLAVRHPLPATASLTGTDPYVVVHPGASVPARAWPAQRAAETVVALAERGHRVVVTGGRDEKELTAAVAGVDAVDLGGRTTLAELAGVLAGSRAVVVANTGPAHLAAAVGTPVVSLFAPTVPAARWAPYGVPAVVLGDQDAPCRGTRATTCPVAGHPCLSSVTAADVLAALGKLDTRRPPETDLETSMRREPPSGLKIHRSGRGEGRGR
jgi:ADP-heptose:LPS heptosyltransferase